jgi:predicted nucleic acid-binding protein
MILCDTNILIEIYRNNAAVSSVVEKAGYNNIAISDVTRAELFYGVRNKTELKMIRENLEQLQVLPVNTTISQMAVNLVEQFCLSHKLDWEDAQIAATAIFHNIELYTLNLKDFSFIPDLQILRYSYISRFGRG